MGECRSCYQNGETPEWVFLMGGCGRTERKGGRAAVNVKEREEERILGLRIFIYSFSLSFL